jgi:hypothetical protein
MPAYVPISRQLQILQGFREGRGLPDETSSGVIICSSGLVTDGAAVQANPFAPCI